MSLHEMSMGYDKGTSAYVTGRPGYPPEAIEWLRNVLGVGPGRTVLEVGAGTGKFIPVLQEGGGDIKTVEPIKAMREQLRRDFPAVEALDGTADAIPLPNASVDVVVCAQAFHWFATSAALQEMRRVLVPGGTLGLIWNGRDESVPWVAELSKITDQWEGDTPRYLTGEWRRAFPAPGFEFLGERHVRNAHVGPAEQVVVKRTLSVSFIAGLPIEQQKQVEREVRALVDRTPELANGSEVTFPYQTSMFAYRKV